MLHQVLESESGTPQTKTLKGDGNPMFQVTEASTPIKTPVYQYKISFKILHTHE
jgi:hypothetical protein